MASRIEVGFKNGIRDALGEKIKKRIIDNLSLPVEKVSAIEVYTITGDLSKDELNDAACGPLSDPVIQNYSINKPLAGDFDWLIEVGFRPGVTDNVGKTAREAIELLLGSNIGQRKIAVYTSRQYLICGKITKKDAEEIATGLLANDLIERYQIVPQNDFNFDCGMPVYIPQVSGKVEITVEEINLNAAGADELIKISKERILALNPEEMQAIQNYYRNENIIKKRKKRGLSESITDVEMECLAQTWSEHCKHKIFNSLIKYNDGKKKKQLIHFLKLISRVPPKKYAKPKAEKIFVFLSL